MPKYLARYRHKGEWWSIQFEADNHEDAEARLGRMSSGSVDGRHVMTVPGVLAPLAGMVAWLRNNLFRV